MISRTMIQAGDEMKAILPSLMNQVLSGGGQ